MARWKWTMEFGDMMGPEEPEGDRFQICDCCRKPINLEDYNLAKCVECGCEVCQDCEGPPVEYVSGRQEPRCVSCDPANSEPDPDEAYDRLKAALERGTERLRNDPSQHVFGHLNGISSCGD